MFEAKLLQANVLKKALEAMKEMVKEGNWECSSSGISMQSMDQSHVALIILSLKEALFDKYRCDRNVTLGISHDTLSKILKCAANDDVVTLKASDQPDELNVLLQSNHDEKTSEFIVKLIDYDGDQLGIPDTEYTATVKLPSGEFQRICRDLSQFGDTVVISVKKGTIEFSGSGQVGSAKIVLKENSSIDEDDKISIEMDKDQPCCLSFANRYLNNFTKATPLSDNVTLQLCPEHPLVVSYDISDMGYMKFYLAPKIEEED